MWDIFVHPVGMFEEKICQVEKLNLVRQINKILELKVKKPRKEKTVFNYFVNFII